jgi:hypothetical protein
MERAAVVVRSLFFSGNAGFRFSSSHPQRFPLPHLVLRFFKSGNEKCPLTKVTPPSNKYHPDHCLASGTFGCKSCFLKPSSPHFQNQKK